MDSRAKKPDWKIGSSIMDQYMILLTKIRLPPASDRVEYTYLVDELLSRKS
jgi:hypothetical protein